MTPVVAPRPVAMTPERTLLKTSRGSWGISPKFHGGPWGRIRGGVAARVSTGMARHRTSIVAICLGMFALSPLSAQEVQLQLSKRATVKGKEYVIGFTTDDKRLVCHGGTVKVLKRYDVATGKEVSSVKGPAKFDAPYALAVTPDFKTMATVPHGGPPCPVLLWDLQAGKKIATMLGHTGSVERLAFSPDGKTLASASQDGTVRLWDVPSGKELATLKGNGLQSYIDFSADGKRLASGGWDKAVRIWDVATHKELGVFKGHANVVLDVKFSPDGTIVASGSHDGTLRLWDVATGKARATLKGHVSEVYCIAFSPDGKIVASGSRAKVFSTKAEIKFWDVASRKEIAHRLISVADGDWVRCIMFSHDGRTLVTDGGYAGDVTLWDVATKPGRDDAKPADPAAAKAGLVAKLTATKWEHAGRWVYTFRADGTYTLAGGTRHGKYEVSEDLKEITLRWEGERRVEVIQVAPATEDWKMGGRPFVPKR